MFQIPRQALVVQNPNPVELHIKSSKGLRLKEGKMNRKCGAQLHPPGTSSGKGHFSSVLLRYPAIQLQFHLQNQLRSLESGVFATT